MLVKIFLRDSHYILQLVLGLGATFRLLLSLQPFLLTNNPLHGKIKQLLLDGRDESISKLIFICMCKTV